LNGSREGETLIRTAWQAKTWLHIGAFLPAFKRGPGACDRLFDGSFAGLSGGLDLVGENDHNSPPGQAVEGDEMTALQKADKKSSRQQRKEFVRQLWSSNPGLDVVHRNAAGVDVGHEEHYVAIAPTQDELPVQRFGCFTAELIRMAVWLKGRGVQTVAMQSTGVYWCRYS
jgi:hypothetical protein